MERMGGGSIAHGEFGAGSVLVTCFGPLSLALPRALSWSLCCAWLAVASTAFALDPPPGGGDPSEPEAAVEAVAKAPGAARSETDGDDTWYVATIASSSSGALVTHLWSKGRRFRAESVLAGHRVVTIVNGPYYYTIDPVAGVGVRIERGPKALEDDRSGGRPFATRWQDVAYRTGEKIRDDSLGGQPVEVYQATNDRGRRRVWLAQSEPRLPFRIEQYDRRTSTTNILDYSGWQMGLPISDGFFQPDSNIEIEAVSYAEYPALAAQGPVGPTPVLYRELLHGMRDE